MSRHRDFDAARAETEGEPITFRLAGRDFTIPEIPALAFLEVAASLGGDGTSVVGSFSRFLFETVPVDQHDELRDALREVTPARAIAVVTWLIEEATAVPLEPPSGSVPTSSGNGAASKLAWASEGFEPRSE